MSQPRDPDRPTSPDEPLPVDDNSLPLEDEAPVPGAPDNDSPDKPVR